MPSHQKVPLSAANVTLASTVTPLDWRSVPVVHQATLRAVWQQSSVYLVPLVRTHHTADYLNVSPVVLVVMALMWHSRHVSHVLKVCTNHKKDNWNV